MDRLPVALVVDDEYSNIILFKTILIDFKVETAYSVNEAKSILQKKKIDIIISDFNMPHENGYDLLKWVKKNEINTPFIVVSANRDTDVIKKLILGGAKDFISKPFSIKSLQIKIKQLVKNR